MLLHEMTDLSTVFENTSLLCRSSSGP